MSVLTDQTVSPPPSLSPYLCLTQVISNIVNGSKKGFSGTPTPSLPKITSITKGFRDGELVIFTGPTGTGKTTLLSQLSLDFVKEVPSLPVPFSSVSHSLSVSLSLSMSLSLSICLPISLSLSHLTSLVLSLSMFCPLRELQHSGDHLRSRMCSS
jgi:hypothetical protein